MKVYILQQTDCDPEAVFDSKKKCRAYMRMVNDAYARLIPNPYGHTKDVWKDNNIFVLKVNPKTLPDWLAELDEDD